MRDKRYRTSAFGSRKVLLENFLPYLFFGNLKTLTPVVGSISTLPVNKASMGLQNPVKSESDKYIRLQCARYELIGAVTGEREFQPLTNFRRLKIRVGT